MLNEPRTIPYDFHVFEQDGIVWLFDDSSREFPCTATPHVYAEALYWTDGETDADLPDGALFLASDVARLNSVPVCTFPVETDEREAWDTAREDAQANYRL